MKRREFLKSCAASPVALKTLSGRGLFQGEKLAYDAKGLPTRVLGKTGVSVPLVGFGAGSRFCAVEDPGKSVEVLKKNDETIKNFTVLGPEEMKKIRAGLSPFFEDWALPWMCPGYRDGLKA